jgi:tRNA (Thr-GGU) A37 N-methylase
VAAERSGRAAAERALRDALNRAAFGGGVGYPVHPVGVIESPFTQRRGAARQGLLAPDVRATLRLSPHVPMETCEGLATFSHVYLLWLFHENTFDVKATTRGAHAAGGGATSGGATGSGGSPWLASGRTFSARVAPPGLFGARTGVFATRAPHRPNAIGLSLVRLEGVDAATRTLRLAGCDLLGGTPVIDIKPAAPYDCASCMGGLLARAAPECGCSAGGGGASGDAPVLVPLSYPAAAFEQRLPAWVGSSLAGDAATRLPVAFLPPALAQLRELCDGGALRFYGAGREAGKPRKKAGGGNAAASGGSGGASGAEFDALLRAVVQVLALDIRSVHQGRGGVVAPRTAAGPAADGAAADGDVAPAAPPQRYELYFDDAYIVFTVRTGPLQGLQLAGAGEGGDAGAPVVGGDERPWCCVESVTAAPGGAAVGGATARGGGGTAEAVSEA